jgi:hypothetical protein
MLNLEAAGGLLAALIKAANMCLYDSLRHHQSGQSQHSSPANNTL